ncbi:MAG: AtaL-like protein [Sutterella sp.]|nr:AtaL-like protein [Sutterella sp.]
MFVTFYEHLVRVSFGPQDGITKEALWSEMRESVLRPSEFVEHMLGEEIVSQKTTPTGFECDRHLKFEQFTVDDHVDVLDEQYTVVSQVKASQHFPESSFLMRIEEPESGHLFVRFIYEEEARNENPLYENLRKQAYQVKDQQLVEQLLAQLIKKQHN